MTNIDELVDEILSEINQEGYDKDFEVVVEDGMLEKGINGYYNTKDNIVYIDKYIYENEPRALYDVLKHELIHWYVSQWSTHYRDGEATFEAELRKHKAITNGNFPFADRYHLLRLKDVAICECSQCKKPLMFGFSEIKKPLEKCYNCNSKTISVVNHDLDLKCFKYSR